MQQVTRRKTTRGKNRPKAETSKSSGRKIAKSTTIYDLNDFVIRKIFGYLSDFDLFNVADACSLFRENAQAAFHHRYRSDSFNISVCSNDESVFWNDTQVHLHLHRLPAILRIFGSSMRSLGIALNKYAHKHSQKVIELIVQYCGMTLTELSLAHFELSVELVPVMRPLLSRLQKLQLFWCFWLPDLAESDMLSSCTNLHTLSISGKSGCDPLYSQAQFPKLESFTLSGCNKSHSGTIEDFLTKNPQLKEFAITSCSFVDIDVFQSIANHTPQIERVTFLFNGSLMGHGQASEYAADLKRLTALKSLKIECKAWLLPLITELAAAHIPLEHLALWNCKLSGSGIVNEIAELSQLKKLELVVDIHKLNREKRKFIGLAHLNPSVDVIWDYNLVEYVRNTPEIAEIAFVSWNEDDFIWHKINSLADSQTKQKNLDTRECKGSVCKRFVHVPKKTVQAYEQFLQIKSAYAIGLGEKHSSSARN